jgi:hypothetical protein
MGIGKKIGIVVLVYLILGVVWSVLAWQNIVPMQAGGLEGPANILYLIFSPVSLLVFMILGSLGLM